MTVTDSMNYSSARGGAEDVDSLCEEAALSLRSGNAAEAIETLTQAFRMSYSSNDPSLIGRVLVEMGQAYLTLNEHDRAADCFNTALKKDTSGCGEVLLGAHTGLGHVYHHNGQTAESIGHLMSAAKAAKAANLRSNEAALLNEVGDLHLHSEQAKEAYAVYTRALDAARSGHSPEGETAAHIGAAAAAAALDDYEHLALHCDQALLAMRNVKSRLMIRGMRDKVTHLMHQLGETQQMIDLELALVEAYSGNQISAAMQIHIDLAKALVDRGESDKALAHLETARGYAQTLMDRKAETRVLGQMADIYEASGLSYLSVGLYDEGVRMAREVGDRELELAALEALAAAQERVGDLDCAIQTLQRAYLLVQSKCDRQMEAAYLYEQALLQLKLRNIVPAIEALERARKTLPDNTDPALASEIRQKLRELKPTGGLSSRVIRS